MSNTQQHMKSINVKILMGHSLGVEDSYYYPKESEVLEDYLNAVDALTIDPRQKLEKKVQQLEGHQAQEIVQLKARLAAREEQDRKDHEQFQKALKWAVEMGRHGGIRPSDRARLRRIFEG